MGRPQQPEIARSGRTELDPDSIGTELTARKAPRTKGRTGPVPPANQPGHKPDQEADKPDLDAFASKLSAGDDSGERAPAPTPPSVRREPVAASLALLPLRVAVRTLGRLEERLSAHWRDD